MKMVFPIKYLRIWKKNVAKDGSTHITASFFNSETEKNKNGKSFLKLKYDDKSDKKLNTVFVSKIIPTDKSDKDGYNLAVNTLKALSNYEKNQRKVEYNAVMVGKNMGNCNVGQTTLNKVTSGQYESYLGMKQTLNLIISISPAHINPIRHFTNQGSLTNITNTIDAKHFRDN